MNTVAVKLIQKHEGLRTSPYTDTVGKLTIGYGRCLDTAGISLPEAEFMLNNDITACETDLRNFSFWPRLNECRQAALIDMRFNLGGRGLRAFTHFLAALDMDDYVGAAEEMLHSKWATQVGNRAIELSKIIKTGAV